MRRKAIVLLIVAVGVGVVSIGWHLHASSTEANNSPVEQLFPRQPSDQLAWPLNRTWLWSVGLPAERNPKDTYSVIVRSVREDVAGENYTIRFREISRQESIKNIVCGALGSGPTSPGTATVGVQLIDFGEVGLSSAIGKQPLRLLLTLERGGRTYLRGPQSVLEGDSFVGSDVKHGQWKDDELHLLNFYVKVGSELVTYDVVLVRSSHE